MSAQTILVLPIYKGSMALAVAVAEAVWSGLPRDRRVLLDYTAGMREVRTYSPGVAGPSLADIDEAAQAIRQEAQWGGLRLQGTAPGHDVALVDRLTQLETCVLILTPWLLMPDPDPERAEFRLLSFIKDTDCRVVGCIDAFGGDDDSGLTYALKVRDAVLRSAGDRLWTVVSIRFPDVSAVGTPYPSHSAEDDGPRQFSGRRSAARSGRKHRAGAFRPACAPSPPVTLRELLTPLMAHRTESDTGTRPHDRAGALRSRLCDVSPSGSTEERPKLDSKASVSDGPTRW